MNHIKHPTLWSAFATAADILTEYKADSKAFNEYMHTGGIGYGESWKESFPLERLNGRYTTQAFHMSVLRDEGGKYELITYIL